ncbi:MAG: class II aldolase/adducin family protein [Gemmatimonadota bacterium]|nr:class II aldolase/adducin family protein [Gemmatimonadota bacterium]
MQTALTPESRTARRTTFAVNGSATDDLQKWFVEGVERELLGHNHARSEEGESPELVINVIDAARPRPFRRNSQGTFVVSVVQVEHEADDLLRAAYPVLVRSLSNLLIYLTKNEAGAKAHFVTLEQGVATVPLPDGDKTRFFAEVYRRLAPLASTRLVINNVFEANLPEELRDGNATTRSMYEASLWLDRMNLLPAAFPIAEILDERDMMHVRRLFGIGGLSYGNLSARHDRTSFWMSARGVNKGNLREIGRDILLITDYVPEDDAMVVSVPSGIEPRAASVDSIEHWMLYREHPGIGAIMHVHAWMDGIDSTLVNYPCGTFELANEVSELVRRQPDPSRTVIGLRNHGLTITGTSLEDIIQRIDGKLLPTVPMM